MYSYSHYVRILASLIKLLLHGSVSKLLEEGHQLLTNNHECVTFQCVGLMLPTQYWSSFCGGSQNKTWYSFSNGPHLSVIMTSPIIRLDGMLMITLNRPPVQWADPFKSILLGPYFTSWMKFLYFTTYALCPWLSLLYPWPSLPYHWLSLPYPCLSLISPCLSLLSPWLSLVSLAVPGLSLALH